MSAAQKLAPGPAPQAAAPSPTPGRPKKAKRLGRSKSGRRRRHARPPQIPSGPFVGLALVSPPDPPRLKAERPPRITRAQARAEALTILADPGAELDALDEAARFYPSRVLRHPAVGLLSLHDPAAWRELVDRCRRKLAHQTWNCVQERLSLDQWRRLTIAHIRREAMALDEATTPAGVAWGGTDRVAHFLEAVMEGQVTRAEARALLRAGVTGGPRGVVIETPDDEAIDANRAAQDVLVGALFLVIGPAERLKVRRGKKRVTTRKYRPFVAIYALTSFVRHLPEPDKYLHTLRWLSCAARALLAGKPLPP